MREYSSACGARVPYSLRSTQLRKHIATQCEIFDISESQTSLLADHMGHDVAIHKKHYKQSCLNKKILQLSKLLKKASDNDLEDNEKDEAKDYHVPNTIPINIVSTNEQNEIKSTNSDSENESEYEVQMQKKSQTKRSSKYKRPSSM